MERIVRGLSSPNSTGWWSPPYTPAPATSGDPPGGLVATTVDPRGIETDFSYTSFGQISQIDEAVGTPDAASRSFTYL